MAIITGDKALDRRLARLSSRGAKAAGRSAVNKGMTVIAKAIRREVPASRASTTSKSGGGSRRDESGRFVKTTSTRTSRAMSTTSIKKSIGSRNKKNRRNGLHEAKVGANVGKKKSKQIPHAHLYLLGTRTRYTASSHAYRGMVQPEAAVPRGFQSSAQQSKSVMLKQLAARIEKEARKQ